MLNPIWDGVTRSNKKNEAKTGMKSSNEVIKIVRPIIIKTKLFL